MTDISSSRDYADKRAWIELQQEVLDAGPDEIDVDLFQNDLQDLPAIGLTSTQLGAFWMGIRMNDTKKRELKVVYRNNSDFVLLDIRLARAKNAHAQHVLNECKSWMLGWKHMRKWLTVDFHN